MKRFLIYSSVLVLGLVTAAMAEANELDNENAISASVTDSSSIDAPGVDAMTYFASGQYLNNQVSTAQQVQSIEPASGASANVSTSTEQQDVPAKASLQGKTDIYVQQGQISAVSEGNNNYAPCTGTSESADECAQGPAVEQKEASMDPSEFPVQNLNDQLPKNAVQASADVHTQSNAAVKSEKVTDTKTGVKTNIIMNTDTGVDISR